MATRDQCTTVAHAAAFQLLRDCAAHPRMQAAVAHDAFGLHLRHGRNVLSVHVRLISTIKALDVDYFIDGVGPQWEVLSVTISSLADLETVLNFFSI
jgi:hypothetical protein